MEPYSSKLELCTVWPKKNVVSWENSHNYPQTHPKCKCWGCIGKFRIFATTWALRFSKLKKKWLRKWSLKLPTPLQKSAEFTAHIMHSFDDPLHFHDLQWKQNLFHTLVVEGKVKVVLYSWPDVSSSRNIMPQRMAERINQCKLRAENSADFWRGGWQLQASFSQSFLLQFWKS